MRTLKLVAALSVAGAISLSYAPAQAVPLTPLSAAAKPSSLGSGAIQVRWGGWHGGGGWGHGWHGGGLGWGAGALAAGALFGAAIASPYYDGGYGYGDGYPYYGGSPYGYSAAYYPAYGYYRPYRRHYAGYGPYWRHSYGMYRVHHHRHW
jgi:hypothetical protein